MIMRVTFILLCRLRISPVPAHELPSSRSKTENMNDLSKLVKESLSLTTPLGSTLIVLRMGALLDGSSW